MAGVMTVGDEGKEVNLQQVTAIGGADVRAKMGVPATVPIVQTAHYTDQNRAEGVNYPEAFGNGGPTGSGYPAGTAMTDSTPNDDVN